MNLLSRMIMMLDFIVKGQLSCEEHGAIITKWKIPVHSLTQTAFLGLQRQRLIHKTSYDLLRMIFLKPMSG